MTQIISVTQHGNFTSGIKEENFTALGQHLEQHRLSKSDLKDKHYLCWTNAGQNCIFYFFIPQSETCKDSICVKLLLWLSGREFYRGINILQIHYFCFLFEIGLHLYSNPISFTFDLVKQTSKPFTFLQLLKLRLRFYCNVLQSSC